MHNFCEVSFKLYIRGLVVVQVGKFRTLALNYSRRENMEDVEKLDVVGVGTEKVEEEVTEQT